MEASKVTNGMFSASLPNLGHTQQSVLFVTWESFDRAGARDGDKEKKQHPELTGRAREL
jgi:hypothetical protein